jgi:hypothetical protein
VEFDDADDVRATLLGGGHAPNALPQLDGQRELPDSAGVSPNSITNQLVKIVADPKITVSFVNQAQLSKPSPLRPDPMTVMEALTKEMFPGVVIVPVMSTGATDGLFLQRRDSDLRHRRHVQRHRRRADPRARRARRRQTVFRRVGVSVPADQGVGRSPLTTLLPSATH